MTINELLQAIQSKSIEIEKAIEAGKPQEELIPIYNELKELQFQKVQIEMDAIYK